MPFPQLGIEEPILVSVQIILYLQIHSIPDPVSSLAIGSLATWRYYRRQKQLADEAIQNYESLQTEFGKEIREIRKSYSDFKVILGVEEDEVDDRSAKGGPEMPELFDIPVDELSLAYRDMDNAPVEASALLTEAASLKSDLDNLTRIVSERRIEFAITPSIWPVKFEPKEQLWISSGFGRRRDPFTKRWTMHAGADIPAPRRTPVIATANGTIAKIGKDAYLGNYIEICHNDRCSTVYGHMDRFAKDVKKGTSVAKGDVIGYVGRTGRATGSHVHYEVKINGKRVNPKGYILN
ncbi:M23 family metallopeptidase [Candidatus Poribacteria bacterium]